MPTINLTLSDTTDVSRALSILGEHCERHGIKDRQQIVQEVEDIACDLELRGKELASLGSQFKATRNLTHDNCSVRITATYGIPQRKSPFAWFSSLFSR